jgi:Protein of unknown function (DUF2510)/Domain of unknown function (DUF4352)
MPDEQRGQDEFSAFRDLNPGWYRDRANPTMARYWDGQTLGDERRPIASPALEQAAPLWRSKAADETTQQPANPEGWYADPTNPSLLRYWDGRVWTEHAKALRPWYKKTRTILAGLLVLLVLLVVIVVVVNVGTTSSSSGKGSSSGAVNAAATSTGCARTHPSYPHQQSTHDCVAPLTTGSVSIANTTVTASWFRTTDLFRTTTICANVVVNNHNNETISYNPLYWSLQTPSGQVVDTNFTGTLKSGDLVAHGTATGTVCFDDSRATGTYVGIYKPAHLQANRGIWLFTP